MFHSTPLETSGRSFQHDISNNLPLRPNTYNLRLFPSLFSLETAVLAAKIQAEPLSTQLLSLPILVNKPSPEHMWTIANNYSSLFDTLFFHNTLTPHISIVFQPMNIEGYYSPTNKTIYISTNVSWERAKVGHAGSELLSTLLHEMMHVFFHFWGDETLMQIPASAGGIGRGGHGRVWLIVWFLLRGRGICCMGWGWWVLWLTVLFLIRFVLVCFKRAGELM